MLIIAHRGASGRAPENTLAAFRMALDLGAKAFEFDVHQTKDGRLVVIHDGDLKRVAGLRKKIKRMTWDEVRAADAGSWFAERFKGEKIPSLDEVLDLAQGRAEVHAELKAGSKTYPGIEERLARAVESRKAWTWIMISSFDHRALRTMRAISQKARLGYLLGPKLLSGAWRDMAKTRAESLNLSARQATKGRVRQAHKRGLKVFVYTVNDAKTLSRMERLGVDGVYSNFPEMNGLRR
ncbi:MAG: glycerophosphodiester phosphodiesterase [bacterium]